MNPQAGEKNRKQYDVSVIVLSYHPDAAQERKTLLSILKQKGISFEIIIADDGSEKNNRDEIVSLFEAHGFSDYTLVMNKENKGTIANLYSGLEAAKGEYTKCISPGDFLAGETVLKDWIAFIRKEGTEWSFSEAVFYQEENGTEQPVQKPSFPVWVSPYLENDREKARWNYVILDDIAYGCVMIAKTGLMVKYTKELLDNGCRYAEDYMFRIMMFDGVFGSYYPEGTVFYESGTGISSGKSKKWMQILADEYQIMSRIIMERETEDPFKRKMARMVHRKVTMIAMIFVPGTFRRFVKVSLRPRIFDFDFKATEAWRRSLDPC